MGQKESLLRVLAIRFPSESTYSVPDNALWLRDPHPQMETGVCCAVGKAQSQTAVAQSDVRSFQDVPLQQKGHHWPSSCRPPPHPALFVFLQKAIFAEIVWTLS